MNNNSSGHLNDVRVATPQSCGIVWLDHAQARVIRWDEGVQTLKVVRPEGGTPHLHHKANSIDDGHAPENQAFFHAVGRLVDNLGAVLVTGPANAKTEFMKHLARHDVRVFERVVEVRTVDHPTDAQLADMARRHFEMGDPAALGSP